MVLGPWEGMFPSRTPSPHPAFIAGNKDTLIGIIIPGLTTLGVAELQSLVLKVREPEQEIATSSE